MADITHQLKRRRAGGDVIGPAQREPADCPTELYICIIDKRYLCQVSINIYLYDVSLCLIVTGWSRVLGSCWQGGAGQECCQMCLYAGLQLGLFGRDSVCMQTVRGEKKKKGSGLCVQSLVFKTKVASDKYSEQTRRQRSRLYAAGDARIHR